MVELRALSIAESKAMQKFIAQKSKELNGEPYDIGVAAGEWMIEHIYPELKGKELYPDFLADLLTKTNKLTKDVAEKQANELVKNW